MKTMAYRISLQGYSPAPVYELGADFTGTAANGERLFFNNFYLQKNGAPFLAVSGEFHYSRMNEARWEDELIKMRLGGINVVATYVFWNHIEEEESVFDFTGARNVRKFVQLCAKHGLYVILRVGPFAHGEVRNGGLPDWLYGKPFEVRHTNAGFLACVERLYAQIGEQVKGLFFCDNGPIIGVQLDNEYMHSSAMWEMTTGISDEWVFRGNEGESYILALRRLALACGLTPAFFTGTAWGGAAYSPKVMPLWGGYAYRPWIFYSHKGEHPATEEYVYEDYHRSGAVCADDFTPEYVPEERPYACCEMGGGMMCCYYYRFVYPYRSVDAMANIKLGSGCNFIGYYMFQGGTNPLGKQGGYLNEAQVPKRSYDYQAALGEFGQLRESYSRLKAIHYFLNSFGSLLAPMETVLPQGASQISPEDLQTLRFAVRTNGSSGFLFLNNFQDHRTMPHKQHETVYIETDAETYRFDVSLATDENAILPFRMELDGILLLQANAQPVLRTEINGRGTYVFLLPDGMDGTFRFEEAAEITGSRTFFTVRARQRAADVLVLTREEANRLFLLRDGSLLLTDAALLEDEHGGLRLETTQPQNRILTYPPQRLINSAAARLSDEGVFGVYRLAAEVRDIPVQLQQAAPYRWVLRVPRHALDGLKDVRLQIRYHGDIGMLWLDNELISDHFCNGDVWEIGLLEHRHKLDMEMVLRIAPIRDGADVHAESAMAARSEEVKGLSAALYGVQAQPVYELRLQ